MGEGLQHKGALGDAGVGEDELRGVQDLVPVKQQVQIQGPGPPVNEALPVRRLLDFLQLVQQLQGIEQRVQSQAAV